jgi:hypothetical protein
MPRRRRPKIQPRQRRFSGCNGGFAAQMGQRRRADPTLHARERAVARLLWWEDKKNGHRLFSSVPV